jgi:hypothetical protein
MGNALASKTGTVVALLVGRHTDHGESYRSQNDIGLLRRPTARFRPTASPSHYKADVRRVAGMGLVRNQRSPSMYEMRSVGFVDTRRDLSEIINFNKGIC